LSSLLQQPLGEVLLSADFTYNRKARKLLPSMANFFSSSRSSKAAEEKRNELLVNKGSVLCILHGFFDGAMKCFRFLVGSFFVFVVSIISSYRFPAAYHLSSARTPLSTLSPISLFFVHVYVSM
jgi:hypothetical protein